MDKNDAPLTDRDKQNTWSLYEQIKNEVDDQQTKKIPLTVDIAYQGTLKLILIQGN